MSHSYLPKQGAGNVLEYNPGLHILSELVTPHITLLDDHLAVREFFYTKIEELNLNALGEVWHKFENGGYTGVICLTESHIAIHTWPEHGIVTFDIYLSNFRKNNDANTRSFFEDTVKFFKAASHRCKEVKR